MGDTMSGHDRRSSSSRARSATPPACSTPSTARPRATPTSAPPPERPYAEELERRARASCGSGSSTEPRRPGSRSIPRSSPRRRRRRELLESLGHEIEERQLADADARHGDELSAASWSAGRPARRRCSTAGERDRPAVHRRRRRAADLGAGRGRARARSRRVPRGRRPAPARRPDHRRLARLRASTCCSRRRWASRRRRSAPTTTPGPTRWPRSGAPGRPALLRRSSTPPASPAISLPLHWTRGRASGRRPAGRPARRARAC